jgi:hypothetical protein
VTTAGEIQTCPLVPGNEVDALKLSLIEDAPLRPVLKNLAHVTQSSPVVHEVNKSSMA